MYKNFLLLIILVVTSLQSATTNQDFELLDGKGIILNDSSNVFETKIQAPSDLNDNVTLTLPSTPPQDGQFLVVDNNGKLSWVDNNSTTTNSNNQKIDKFILEDNQIKISLSNDEEVDKVIDLSSVTSFLKSSDLKNDLISTDIDKPLSANQGRELKKLVDTLNSALTSQTSALSGLFTTHTAANNPHKITKEIIGLNKVDNTTDLDKPISIATKSALDLKAQQIDLDAVNELLSKQISEVNQSISDNQAIDLLDFNGTHLTISLENDDSNKTIKLDRYLSSLEDINITTLSDGQILRYDINSSKWKAQTLPEGTTVVDTLNSVETTQALSANQGNILNTKIVDLNSSLKTLKVSQNSVDSKISDMNSSIVDKSNFIDTKLKNINDTIISKDTKTNSKIKDLNNSLNSKVSNVNTQIAGLGTSINTLTTDTNKKVSDLNDSTNEKLDLKANKTDLIEVNQTLTQKLKDINSTISDNQSVDILDFNGTHLTISLDNNDTNKTITLDRNLTSLSDVNLTDLATGKVLTYDADILKWIAKDLPVGPTIFNDLNSTSQTQALSAKQGKVLDEKIKMNDENITKLNTAINSNDKNITKLNTEIINNKIKLDQNITDVKTLITALDGSVISVVDSVNDLNTINIQKLLDLNNSTNEKLDLKANKTELIDLNDTLTKKLKDMNSTISDNQSVDILDFNGTHLTISLDNNDTNKTIALDRSLDSLSDVNLTNLTQGQVLEYNATANIWTPKSFDFGSIALYQSKLDALNTIVVQSKDLTNTNIEDINNTIKTNNLELNSSINTNTTNIATIQANINDINDSMSEYNQTIQTLEFDGNALKISLSNNGINKTIILDRNISSLGDVEINLENLEDGQVLEYNLTAKMWMPASAKSVANFTPITVPADPIKGDIYLDESDNTLKAFDGTSWHNLWSDDKVFKNEPPISPTMGDVYVDKVDETHGVLKAFDGEEWYILGANSNDAYIQPITQGELTELIKDNKPITRSALLALISAKENVTDVNTSLITDMSDLFKGYKSFNQDISKWDVSNVTTMSHMFDGAEGFDQNISTWNVSEVLDMSYMFRGAKSFNQDISSWDISKVTDMSHMFDEATAFNQPLLWSVTNVTNMESMFQNATAFNQNISSWNVSNVTNMKNMLVGATAFNQDISSWNVDKVADSESFSDASDSTVQKPNFPLSKAKLMEMIDGGEDVTSVDISKIIDMSNLFINKPDFNQNISGWNVSNVTNMSKMFRGLTIFNQDISAWDVSSVTDMSDMFNGATAFNQNISSWDVTNVTNMSGMFNGAIAFTQDISGWDVFKVLDMGHMFDGATAFNQNISGWNISNVTKMNYMFNGATSFNQNISSWNVSKVATMDYMFKGATVFDQNISMWNVNKVSMRNNFADSTLVESKRPKFPLTLVELKAMIAANEDVTQVNTSLITDMSYLFKSNSSFNQDISGWDVSNVTDMSYMFNLAESFDQDISGWDVSNVTDMHQMFYNTTIFNQDISGWDVSNVTDMGYMFDLRNHFNQDLSSWDVSKVYISNNFASSVYTAAKPNFHLSKKELLAKIAAKEDITNADISAISDMSGLFNGNRSFIGLGSIEDWNVSHVTNMSSMFSLVTGFNQDISKWDVSNVTDMSHMFYQAKTFNQNIGDWNVSNVTNTSYMFDTAEVFNQFLNNWDVSNVTDMKYMFARTKAFNQPLNSWNVSNVTDIKAIFYLTTIFNQPLNSWDTSHVINMSYVFDGAIEFNQDISNWDVRTVTSHINFSTSSNLLPEYIPIW